jgi:type IV pilus assembly protein PilE
MSTVKGIAMTSCKVRVGRLAGFTLIEVMITVAIVAIIAAIAVPSYSDYVTRSRLVEAKSGLADMRTRLEQHFLDNRAYPTACIAPASGPAGAGKVYLPGDTKFFTFTCDLTATTYTVTATGTGTMAGFAFTVDQANARRTTRVRTGWTASDTCWISRKNGEC